jgi:predicted nucleotidyltransferase
MIYSQDILDILKSELKLHPLRVKNIYMFGSRCYGNYNDKSDYDFIVIANNSVENIEHTIGDYNFHIQTLDYFKSRMLWNHIGSLECLYYPNKILEKEVISPIIDKSKLRHSISHTSSNSWVKAKKKILQNDIYIGQKSLYHSLRIPLFGTQILQHGDIIDWQVANKYWEDIMGISDWDILKERYQPIRNKIMSEFRLLVK